MQVELKGRLLIAKEILWSGTEFRSRAIATKRSGSVWVLFNPCSREGSDPWSCIPARPYSNFNPRSCEGSDFRPDHDIITFARFQSTHPRGERRSNHQSPCVSSKFQSTLPRGERLYIRSGSAGDQGISIHAPARGATCALYLGFDISEISIHAPARGATHHPIPSFFPVPNFNPRSREGSDCSRVRLGGRLCIFQSTLPRGERLASRPVPLPSLQISIHAPARGATPSGRDTGSLSPISIHAPARGATYHPGSCCIAVKFQSTLPRGERPSPVAMTARSIVFQSTLPRGERLCSCRSATLLEDFNPRSREGSDNYGYQIAHRL